MFREKLCLFGMYHSTAFPFYNSITYFYFQNKYDKVLNGKIADRGSLGSVKPIRRYVQNAAFVQTVFSPK